jgi:hypothetical protein
MVMSDETEDKVFPHLSENMNQYIVSRHTHGELAGAEKIVYYEADLLEILKEYRAEIMAEKHLPDLTDLQIDVMEASLKIAEEFMKAIQYDAGAINYQEEEKYPEQWLKAIAFDVCNLMLLNPDLDLDEDTIDDIVEGEETEVQEKYGSLEGFKVLHDTISAYFNQI